MKKFIVRITLLFPFFILDWETIPGVTELDQDKQPHLLELKYKSFTDDAKHRDLLILKYKAITDAKNQLGDIPSIRNTFIGFQEYLYEKGVG